MTSLATTLNALIPGQPCSIPPNWLQGRTAYGGLSSAMALQVALQAPLPGLPPLKAAQVSFIGPVSESAKFTAELLRQGKSVTQIGVDARVDDALMLRASFVFAAARASRVAHQRVQRPEVGPPDAYAPMPPSAQAPGHFQNFDVRFVGDARPLAGGTVPQLTAWVRLKDDAGLRPDVALMAVGDCLPPAALACFREMAPLSSMTWAVDFPQPAEPSTWFLQRSTSLTSAAGYSMQLMEVWDEQQRLVLLSTQTIAIFA